MTLNGHSGRLLAPDKIEIVKPTNWFRSSVGSFCLLSQNWLKPDRHANRQMTAPINATTLAHNYRPDIEELWAVAVLSVVVFHAFPDEAFLAALLT